VSGASYTVTTTSYWSVFWTLLIGFGAAAIGGLVGGSIPRQGRRQRAVTRPVPSPFVDEAPAPMAPPLTADGRENVTVER
jgi:hypothetical protein